MHLHCCAKCRLMLVAGLVLLSLFPVGRTGEAGAEQRSLEETVGQLLLVGFRGTELPEDHWVLEAIRARRLGGVILFDKDLQQPGQPRNIVSPGQLGRLIDRLRAAADYPLLIAVDQEGGRVARLKQEYGFPAAPGHSDLGRSDDLQRTAAAARRIAQTLAAQGINLNLAPVVDLCSNPDNPVIARIGRCFSADPQQVVRHAAAWIEAHHRQGVLTALKHFPGHGSSHSDSHQGFTEITDNWSTAELIPYRQLIENGLADAVMTAHVVNRKLDSRDPATLSGPILQGILRERLGFRGPIISDDLQMGAISRHYPFPDALQKAIDAGVDILLLGNNLSYDERILERTIGTIKTLVADKRLSPARLERSFRRLSAFRERLDPVTGLLSAGLAGRTGSEQ